MPPIASKIEYRNGGQLVADAEASADGLTLRSFDAQGQLSAYVQVSPGRLDVSTSAGVIALTNGLLDLGGDLQISGQFRAISLPTTDPVDEGRFWNDAGTVKVSAG